jgi:hypothetical protein
MTSLTPVTALVVACRRAPTTAPTAASTSARAESPAEHQVEDRSGGFGPGLRAVASHRSNRGDVPWTTTMRGPDEPG